MDVTGRGSSSEPQSEEEMDLRRGPWTEEEDLILMNYIANHGEGRWNSLARCAGLKRTGKSCRLRWLNYLRPDVRRGNITLEEQLLILELHSRWGNRWSKIAQHLPGRTDNEIKNYWRTRVQKHAKQLQCDVNSKQFKDTMRYLWMPRLVERIQAAAATSSGTGTTTATHHINHHHQNITAGQFPPRSATTTTNNNHHLMGSSQINPVFTPENSSTGASSDSIGTTYVSTVSDLADYCYNFQPNSNIDNFQASQVCYPESLTNPSGYFNHGLDFQATGQNNMWLGSGDVSENLWNVEDIWFLQQ